MPTFNKFALYLRASPQIQEPHNFFTCHAFVIGCLCLINSSPHFGILTSLSHTLLSCDDSFASQLDPFIFPNFQVSFFLPFRIAASTLSLSYLQFQPPQCCLPVPFFQSLKSSLPFPARTLALCSPRCSKSAFMLFYWPNPFHTSCLGHNGSNEISPLIGTIQFLGTMATFWPESVEPIFGTIGTFPIATTIRHLMCMKLHVSV